MTKDEMKNRISMALKDPILQQGFEVICSENSEARKIIRNLIITLSMFREDTRDIETVKEANQFLSEE